MVPPDEGVAIFFDKALEKVQFGLRVAVVGGKRDGEEPEFRLEIIAGDVDMGRFRSFAGVEVKAVGTDAQDGGHP